MTVKVAVVGAGPALEAGLHWVLKDEDWMTIAKGDPCQVDVVIYDVMAMQGDNCRELDEILDSGVQVLALGRPLRPDLAARALTHGAAGTLPAEASVDDIVTAVGDIAAGREMSVGIHDATRAKLEAVEGLTPREVTVLRGVARGLSNAEICAELFIGVNTVKSAIRSAYRKIGVTTRSQAMSWCLQHGFEPESDEATTYDTIG
jgi:DNA-binding NarL/FixJ family response regulator